MDVEWIVGGKADSDRGNNTHQHGDKEAFWLVWNMMSDEAGEVIASHITQAMLREMNKVDILTFHRL